MRDVHVKQLRAIYMNILAEEDLEGLVHMGAPRDEYKSEAELLCALGKAPLEPDVVQIFNDQFGGSTVYRSPRLKRVVSRLQSAFFEVTGEQG